MYEIAKHEFTKWERLLQDGELSKYEKTLLSQINDNFDEIATVGTARGARSKLLGEKIRALKNQRRIWSDICSYRPIHWRNEVFS